MRRHEKEVQDIEAVKDIIRNADVVRLAMSKDNQPYVVPLSFGFDGEALYFHCAKEGKKTAYMNANPNVCFEVDENLGLETHEEKACKWGVHFRSVIGFGTAQELTKHEDKVQALGHIMTQYSGQKWDFPDKAVEATAVWRIQIDSMTGKQG